MPPGAGRGGGEALSGCNHSKLCNKNIQILTWNRRIN